MDVLVGMAVFQETAGSVMQCIKHCNEQLVIKLKKEWVLSTQWFYVIKTTTFRGCSGASIFAGVDAAPALALNVSGDDPSLTESTLKDASLVSTLSVHREVFRFCIIGLPLFSYKISNNTQSLWVQLIWLPWCTRSLLGAPWLFNFNVIIIV